MLNYISTCSLVLEARLCEGKRVHVTDATKYFVSTHLPPGYKNLVENDGELEYPASLGSKRYLANTSCDDNDFNFTTRSELSDTESSEVFKEQIETNENDENEKDESNVQQEIRSLPEDDTDDEQNKERDSSVPPQVESVVIVMSH